MKMWLEQVKKDLKQINLNPRVCREVHYSEKECCKRIILDFRADDNFYQCSDVLQKVREIFFKYQPDCLKDDKEFQFIIKFYDKEIQ